MTKATLPTDKQTLQDFFKRDFATMQKQYKRQVDANVFQEPQTLPSKEITPHHLYNVCKYCYTTDTASLELLKHLPLFDTKSKPISETKPPNEAVKKEPIVKEDKENILKAEIEDLRAKIQAKNEMLESLKGEISRSKDETTQAKQAAATALTVAQQRQETISRLQSEVQILQTAKGNADKQLQTAQTTQTSIDRTVQTLQTQHKTELSELSESHKLELSELSEAHKVELSDIRIENEELKTDNDNLKSQIEESEKKRNSFIGKLKSKTVTVLGLLCVVIYQGLHSQHFFADRATNKDDMINMIFSCFAAFAISLAGFLLTIHTKNKVWIWGAAAIDFAIYITPKEMSTANFLAAFAVAASIVAYSHILQEE